MGLVIEEVETKRQLRDFVEFPYRLYKNNYCFVPPLRFDEINTLRKDKNPAFDYCEARYWIARKDGRVAGRVAAILNHAYIEKWKNPYMRFGWLDFEDDQEILKALLEKVETWAREKKMTAVHGPLGFTDLDHEGMLVEGFDQVGTLATIYNFPYYPAHLERLGYTKAVDWVEFRIKMPKQMPEKVSRLAALVRERFGLSVVKARRAKDILPYAKELFELVNSAYADLYGVVPLTERQIKYYTEQYFSFILPAFVPLILDRNGKLAAFGVTMPSLSAALQKSKGKLFPFGFIHLLNAMKKNTVADLYLVAVRKDLQGKGVNALLMEEVGNAYRSFGIREVESNPELENNVLVQSFWDHFDARRHKRRRCYIKNL